MFVFDIKSCGDIILVAIFFTPNQVVKILAQVLAKIFLVCQHFGSGTFGIQLIKPLVALHGAIASDIES